MIGSMAFRGTDRFTAGYYLKAIKRLVLNPAGFFRGIPEDEGMKRPLWFLLTSSIIMAAASLTQPHERPLLAAVAMFVNAMGMPYIFSAIGFSVATALMRKPIRYSRFFAVYAYASGLFVLVAWLPAFMWFGEITKWIFIGIGLVNGIGLKRIQAAVLVGASIGVTFIFFWLLASLLPFIRSA